MSSDSEEISDFIIQALAHLDGPLPGAPTYSSYDEAGRKHIIDIYQIRKKTNDFSAPEEDLSGRLEEIALAYNAQKCAFEDVLTKEGFTLAKEVPKDYHGRIAYLTSFGTFTILGRSKRKGRHITMQRIHTPSLGLNNNYGELSHDPALGCRAHLRIHPGGTQHTSPLLSLAYNPHGADGDELTAHETIATSMGMQTAIRLAEPRKPVPLEES